MGAVAGERETRVVVNGVDLGAVQRLARGFADDPASGSVPFSAQVQWRGGYATDVIFDAYDTLRADEPRALAGGGSGPSPEELLLGAIGHCLAVGYAGGAAAQGVELETLAIDVRGRVNLTAAYGAVAGHPGFEAIEVDVRLEAPGVAAELLDALHASVVARAPIPATVARPTPVTVRLAGGAAVAAGRADPAHDARTDAAAADEAVAAGGADPVAQGDAAAAGEAVATGGAA